MSSNTGEFVLAIPASRISDSYEISAATAGYKTDSKIIKNQSRMNVSFKLRKIQQTASDIIKLQNPKIHIGHYMGLPEVRLPIRIENISAAPLIVKDFSVTLKAPSGKKITLNHTNTVDAQNRWGFVPEPTAVDLGRPLEKLHIFAPRDKKTEQLSAIAVSTLWKNIEFQKNGPKPIKIICHQILLVKLKLY